MTFRAKLAQMWGNVQYTLFPDLYKRIGTLSPTHKKLVSVLELVRIEDHIPHLFVLGRPSRDRVAIARSYIAKIVFKLTYTKQLIEKLKTDSQLRHICGWESDKHIPSESKFSRVFKDFSESQLPDRTHQALIKEFYKDEVVGHIIKDSTALEAREKGLKKEKSKTRKKLMDQERRRKKKAGEPNLRQKQLNEKSLDEMLKTLPKRCDKGMKKNAKGFHMYWKGYKLHTAIDTNGIPVAAILTSASCNDSEVAIPLGLKASKLVCSLYDLMDAAYDYPEIKEHSRNLGHVPIIDKCSRNAIQKKEKEAEKKRKEILNFQTAEDKRYKERWPKESFNALYKDYYGGRTIHFKGHEKVSCHVLFGVLTTAACLLLKFIE